MNQNGRSMVEMLGVLAIIGVLSVGALTGYQKAMLKHKLNKHSEQISLLIGTVSQLLPQLKINDGSTDIYHLIPYLKKLGDIPPEMYIANNENVIQDSFQNQYIIYHHNSGYVGIRVALNDSNESFEICKNIYFTAKEFHDHITNLQIGTTSVDNPHQDTSSFVYGDKDCTKTRLCLKNLQITDTDKLCRFCRGKVTCSLYVIWW